ncbi:DUF5348 domain-containing protein [Bacillus sp. DJP31]|uniref:DUF5348 domain-containing protein n=1 Tax=Bacillus sp. DJP31 TaxID=3409789 RepID=UPI003BB5A1C2
MMKRGILVFDHRNDTWRVWIGQRSYGVEQGQTIELRIRNHYYQAYVEKDFDWFITMNQNVSFNLKPLEIYKVKIFTPYFQLSDAPF